MTIPMDVGLGPVGDDSFAEQILQALLRLQGEGGYASDDDSARVKELAALALALGDGSAALEAIEYGIFPQFAEELLDEHERATRVPNDAARTLEERRARLVAHRAMVPNGSAAELEAALVLAGAPGTVEPVLRASVETSASDDASVFQSAIVVDDWTPKGRRAAAAVLRRFLPAWQYGQLQHHLPEEMLVTDVALAWAGSGTCGQSAIHVGSLAVHAMDRTVSRVKSFAPGTRMNARDLNEMQDALTCAPLPGADNEAFASDLGEARVIFFSASLATASTSQIASGLDFRNRYIRILYSTSANDIRPGQANDGDPDAWAEILWSTMTGVASDNLRSIAGWNLTSSATELRLSNTSGVTRRVFGCLIISPPVTTGTLDTRPVTFADGSSLSGLSSSLWAKLRDAGMPRAANGTGVDTWTGYPTTARGATHRTIVLPKTTRPGAGATTYVLDTTIDWRDRIIAFPGAVLTGSGSADPVFPGVTGDNGYSFAGGATAFYTGTGITPGVAAVAPYMIGGPDLRVAARAADGALIAEHPFGSSFAYAFFMAHVIASDQLNVRAVATAKAVLAAPVDGVAVEPMELNWLQDGGVYSQGEAAVGGTVDAMPLGPVKRGHTNTPVAWTYERRRGRKDDPRVTRRQPVAGRLRRYFSCDVPALSSVVLDATEDWRDRYVHGAVAFSATDITPGGAGEAAINTGAVTVSRSVYFGPGGASYSFAVGANLSLTANVSTGALTLTNSSGATQYATGMLEASFPLGPRSAA